MLKEIFLSILIFFNAIQAPGKTARKAVDANSTIKSKQKIETKKQIMYYRNYLAKNGYVGRTAQLNLLNYIVDLKEIDGENMLILEYLLKANYCIDELDRTNLCLADFLDAAVKTLVRADIESDGEIGFTVKNKVPYQIFSQILTYMPPTSEYNKDYWYRLNPEYFLNKVAKSLAELLINAPLIDICWADVLMDKVEQNLDFLELLREEVSTQGDEFLDAVKGLLNIEQIKVIAKILDQLDNLFETKIKKQQDSMFFKREYINK